MATSTLRPSDFKIFMFKKFNSTKRQNIIAYTNNIYYTHAIILTIKYHFYQTLF